MLSGFDAQIRTLSFTYYSSLAWLDSVVVFVGGAEEGDDFAAFGGGRRAVGIKTGGESRKHTMCFEIHTVVSSASFDEDGLEGILNPEADLGAP